MVPSQPIVITVDGEPLQVSHLPVYLNENKTQSIVRPHSHGIIIKTEDIQLEFDINTIGHPCCSNGCPHIDFSAVLLVDEQYFVGQGSSIEKNHAIVAPINSNNNITTVGSPIHGILGQTVNYTYNPTKDSDSQYLQGEISDYLIKSEDIFGDDFNFNQFRA